MARNNRPAERKDSSGYFGLVDQGIDAVESGPPQALLVQRAPARDGHGGHMRDFGRSRDPDRCLTPQRLLVKRAFSGDNEIGAGDCVGKTNEVEHQRDTRSQLRAEHCGRSEADATRRSRAGFVATIRAGRRCHDVSPIAQGNVEQPHLVGVGTLLRAVGHGGAVGTGQWVVDVASDLHRRVGQVGMQLGDVEPGRRPSAEPAGSHVVARGIRHPGAQSLQHPDPAVSRGTATDAENEVAAAGVECRGHHLTDAPARPGQRGARLAEPRQPRHGRELDHGILPPTYEA